VRIRSKVWSGPLETRASWSALERRIVSATAVSVIGAVDDRGNTIIRGGTAVGYNAQADSTSVAVGAHAGAGGEVMAQLRSCGRCSSATGTPRGLAA